jgi:hypothetical protein
MLQQSFDLWCKLAGPELEDKVGMEKLPDQTFVAQKTSIDKIFKKNRGNDSKTINNTEWLVRRLVEIAAYATTNRDCRNITKNLQK